MNEYDKKVFANNLNRIMEENEKKQADIRKLLNVSKSTVSSWCNAQKMPRMDKIEILAKYFGVLKSDLIEDKSNNDVELSSAKKTILELLDNLNEQQIKEAKNYLEYLIGKEN
ncbi:MAG: helix-turn-helix transcriptional regulator [Eubacterium sp.]